MPDVDLTYIAGTCSVGVGATSVVGVSTLWAQPTNVRQWDLISIDGGPLVPIVASPADDTHLVIPAWAGAVKAGVTYVIYQISPLRFVGAQAMTDVETMLAALNTDGWYRYVNPTFAGPTEQGIVANEGQFALKFTTGQLWIMSGGVWVLLGTFKPFGIAAPYDNAHTYNLQDVATLNGSSYVWINPTSGVGHVPPNATYWAVLAAKGDQGIQGASYAATSTTTENLAALGSTANLLLWSEDFTNGVAWTANQSPTLTANAGVAPDGTTTADQISASVFNTGYFQFVATTIGSQYVFSCFLKYASGAAFADIFDATVTVNVQTGAVISGTATVETLPNGWFRFSVPFTASVASTGVVAYTGSNAATALLVWGAQLTPGSGNFGYVKTTSAPASGLSLLTQSGLAYQTGTRVRVASTATPADYFEMLVTQYAGSILTGAVVKIAGSGTFSNWTLGLTGDAGLGYGGSSATSFAIGTGSKTFTGVYKYLAYQVGNYVRAASAASGVNFMEGNVTDYSDGTLTINITKIGGSGTHTDWNFQVAGAPGAGNVNDVNGQTGSIVSYFAPQGRITLASGVPVMSASQAAKATVYYTPAAGNLCPIYDGTNMVPIAFSELSQSTTDATKSPAAVAANSVYDIFVWNDGGTLRATRGPAWANSTTRGYTFTMVNGILLNTSAITNAPAALRGTWVGTIASNGTSTIDYQFGGSASGGQAASLMVANAYNTVHVATAVNDNGVPYSYTSATPRQARGSVGNQISFLVAAQENSVIVSYGIDVNLPGVVGVYSQNGIGFDTNTAYSIGGATNQNATANPLSVTPGISGVWPQPSIGVHTIYAVENSDGTHATSYGTNNVIQSGWLSAALWM